MSKTPVYVSAGVTGGFPGHTKREHLGAQVGAMSAIHTSALKPDVPGVDLRQVQSVNGIAVDSGASINRVDMTPRTVLLKK